MDHGFRAIVLDAEGHRKGATNTPRCRELGSVIRELVPVTPDPDRFASPPTRPRSRAARVRK